MIKKLVVIFIFWGVLGLIVQQIYVNKFTPHGQTLQDIYTYCGGINPDRTKCAQLSNERLDAMSNYSTSSALVFLVSAWIIGSVVEFYKSKSISKKAKR